MEERYISGESMNYLWGCMIVAGIVYAALTGSLPDVTQAAIDSSKEAVTLCVTMTGVDEDCGKIRHYFKCCQVHEADFANFISEDTERSFGESVYCGKFYCKCVWIGMGGYAGWDTGD